MLIIQPVITFLLFSPALAFLSTFDTYSHSRPRHTYHTELDVNKAYKPIGNRGAYSNSDVFRHAHPPHASFEDAARYSLQKRMPVRGSRPRKSPRVSIDDSGVARSANSRQVLETNSASSGSRAASSFKNGGTVRKVSSVGSPPGSPRSRPGSPGTRSGGIPRTGSAPNLKSGLKPSGSQSTLKKNVSFKNLDEAAEHGAEGSLRHVGHTTVAEGEMANVGHDLEESSNPEAKAMGVAATTAGLLLNRLSNGPEGAEVKKAAEDTVSKAGGEVKKLEQDIHLGHHDKKPHEGTNPPQQPNGFAKQGKRPRPPNRQGNGGNPVRPTGNAPANNRPPHDPDDSNASEDHDSDEHKSDLEAHQDQWAAIGQKHYQGLRPRPDFEDTRLGRVKQNGGESTVGGGTEAGGGGGGRPPLAGQSIRGRPTRYGVNVKKPPKVKPYKAPIKSAKHWNAWSTGLTAAGVMIAGGATIGSTIAAEKGAEANEINADASTLSAQAAQKNADASQLSSKANVESAHANTIIAEANIKNANASKENADGTYLNAAVTYQTAVHTPGVNTTAALQMQHQAEVSNSKKRRSLRKRSYPPVILYTHW
jgi:hypothetical protein